MPENFFITGLPKAGKTTILSKIVEELRAAGLRVGGFVSPEEKHQGKRTGFYLVDLDSGKQILLADLNSDGPKVSKYHVNLREFEDFVAQILEDTSGYDVIVLDEIGRMELKSNVFSDFLDELLESDKPVIASLHNDLVFQYGAYGEVLFLNEDNREAVFEELVEKVRKAYEPENEEKPKRIKRMKKSAPKPEPKVLNKRTTRQTREEKKIKKRKYEEEKYEEPEEEPEPEEENEYRAEDFDEVKPKIKGKGLLAKIRELLGF